MRVYPTQPILSYRLQRERSEQREQRAGTYAGGTQRAGAGLLEHDRLIYYSHNIVVYSHNSSTVIVLVNDRCLLDKFLTRGVMAECPFSRG